MSFVTLLNAAGRSAVDWAGAMFVQSSLLILLLLLVEFGLRQRLRAVIRCGLWTLVLLKLLLPPSLALPTSAAYWLRSGEVDAGPGAVATATTVTSLRFAPATTADENQESIPGAISFGALTVAGGLLLVWMAGALTFALRLGGRTRAAMQMLRRTTSAPPELQSLTDEVAAGLGLRATVPARTLAETVTPAVCGWLRPVILLPARLVAQLEPPALRAVLIHELTHVRRHDVAVNLLQSMLQIVYWWHPLVWLANARLRQAREEAVDEAVAVAMGSDTETYPATLVEVARLVRVGPRLNLGLVGVFESRGSLSRRIHRLLGSPVPGSARLGVRGAAVLALFAALALPMAKAQPKPRPASEEPVTTVPAGFGPAASRAHPDQGGVGEAKKVPRLLLAVRAQPDGNAATYEIDGKAVEADQLETTLKARVADAPDTLLVLRAEQEVPFTVVSRAVQAASAAGVTHVSLSTAPEAATTIGGMGPTPADVDAREIFVGRYGLQVAGTIEAGTAGDSRASPTATTVAGGLSPELQRRYGLGPEAGGQAGGGPGGVTSTGGLSPELQRRYGLGPTTGAAPGGSAAGAGFGGSGGRGAGGGGAGFGGAGGGGSGGGGASGAGGGVISSGGGAGSVASSPGIEEGADYSSQVRVPFQMDPAMARRYGLGPAVSIEVELLAVPPNEVDPLLAATSYSITSTGDRLWVLDPAQTKSWQERRQGHAGIQVLSAPTLTVMSGLQGSFTIDEKEAKSGTGRQITMDLTPSRKGTTTSIRWKTTIAQPGAGADQAVASSAVKALSVSTSASIQAEATLSDGGALVLEPLQPRARDGRAYVVVVTLPRAK